MLALLWVAGFACYILGLSNPAYGMFGLGLITATPFFVALRLHHFRDYGREGFISFGRGWAYVVLMFFYGSVLFALAVYAYFTYMDHGFMLEAIRGLMAQEENRQMLRLSGMEQMLEDSLQQMEQMRAIDLAINMLATNIMAGMVLGFPIAALLRRKSVEH